MSTALAVSGDRLKSMGAVMLAAVLIVPAFSSSSQGAPPRPSSLAISDVTVTEGNSGTMQATFTVTMKGRATPTTVGYNTSDGSATSPSDYQAASGMLQFSGGVKKATITISVNGDTLGESNESFQVVLSNPTGNVTISDGVGLGSILNDDAAATLSIDDSTVGEGDLGTTPARFTVSLSAPTAGSVTVGYTTSNGTAASGSDYEALAGTLTFTPGDTSETVDVNVIGDLVSEPDETFQVDLSNASGASITDAAGLGTIIDDEAVPAVSVNDATVQEGDGGTANLVFTVTLSHTGVSTATVDYATADATADAANDYTATSGTLTFAPGETSQTVTVPVAGDAVDEADETLHLRLLNPSNLVLADSQGLGTITDDDATPSVSIGDVMVTEGNSGVTPATLVVSLSNPSSRPVDVGFDTDDGTAVAPGDYAARTGTVTIGAGQLQATIEIAVARDTVYEPDETFSVFLTSTTYATLADGEGTGTIANDDRAPTTTSLRIRKGRDHIRASGRVAPAQRGQRMVVKLLKRRNGRFVKIATKRPTLGRGIDTNGDGVLESGFSTRFARPRRGRCRVVARFGGNANYAPSTTRRTFDC
jgi:large repetitive protein